ncbi:MAG: hypothetical protein J6N15_11715 [Ruminiclostridium sp.]|nr:hypothetical protein [Ruminiclostridium sp.]
MANIENGFSCKNCGAPATSEICPYCGSPTGLDTARANMEYPTLECKEANLNFWTVMFPMIFALSFGFAGMVLLVVTLMTAEEEEKGLLVLCSLPFLGIGIAALVIVLLNVSRYLTLKKHGKRIDAVVYGYTDDIMRLNDRPAQVVKLLVDTPEGKRFIMYQLGGTDRPYGVNTTIGLIVYRDIFMIEKNKQYIKW